jgi:hypothetical protein
VVKKPGPSRSGPPAAHKRLTDNDTVDLSTGQPHVRNSHGEIGTAPGACGDVARAVGTMRALLPTSGCGPVSIHGPSRTIALTPLVGLSSRLVLKECGACGPAHNSPAAKARPGRRSARSDLTPAGPAGNYGCSCWSLAGSRCDSRKSCTRNPDGMANSASASRSGLRTTRCTDRCSSQ